MHYGMWQTVGTHPGIVILGQLQDSDFTPEEGARNDHGPTDALDKCLSTAGPRPGTGPRKVLLEFVALVF